MKKTFKELNKFSLVTRQLVERDPEILKTKFGYAIKKFEEINLTKPYKEYNEVLLDLRINLALVDKETDAILRDEESPRGFKYSKEGFKAIIKAEKDLEEKWADKEFEIEPYICKSENIPEDLTEEQVEVLTGLVM